MKVFWFAAFFFFQSQLPDQVQPGSVTGRLHSPNGTPASGVRVAAIPADEGNDKIGGSAMFGISQTDAEGRFRLEKLPPGRYYIFAGLIDFPSYYPSAKSLEQATAIRVDPGSTISGVNFVMARPASLTVAGHLSLPPTMRVSDNWQVTLTTQPRGPGTAMQVKVGTDGAFAFERVLPGDYRISTNIAGTASESVKVTDADLTNIVIPVVDCNSGVLVSGRLIGTPATVVQSISLSGSGSGCSARARVESDGSFSFNRVPEGRYQLQLSPMPLGWEASSLTVGTTDLTGTQIELPHLIAIRGRAFAEDEISLHETPMDPLPVRAVLLQGGPIGEVNSTIQRDGTFELLLPRGEYRISVPRVPEGYRVKSIASGSTDLQRSTLTVRETSSTTNEIRVTFAVDRVQETGVRLSGRLSFASTGAVPNSEGVLLVPTTGRRADIRESIIGTDGSFEFTNVPRGTYDLETIPDNPVAMHGIVVDADDIRNIMYVVPVLVQVKGGIDWADSQGNSVPARQTNISVQFTRKDGSRMMAWGALAESGSFHFYLPEGDYRFSLSDAPPGFNLSSVTVGDTNILETGLRVRSESDPPNLRVMMRGK